MYVYTHFVIMSKLQESLTKIGISLIEKWDSLTDSFGQGIRSYTRRINGKKQKKKRLLEKKKLRFEELAEKGRIAKLDVYFIYQTNGINCYIHETFLYAVLSWRDTGKYARQ